MAHSETKINRLYTTIFTRTNYSLRGVYNFGCSIIQPLDKRDTDTLGVVNLVHKEFGKVLLQSDKKIQNPGYTNINSVYMHK